MGVTQDYLASQRGDQEGIWFANRITCADGFTMSVQVHSGAYCRPRNGVGPKWSHAEIGFPTDRPSDAIMEYAEEPEEPTQTVYGYVPLELIDAEIERHGGIA